MDSRVEEKENNSGTVSVEKEGQSNGRENGEYGYKISRFCSVLLFVFVKVSRATFHKELGLTLLLDFSKP